MTGRPRDGVNTPGALGYVAAVALSIVLFGALLGVVAGGSPAAALGTAVLVVLFGWVYAVPVGVAGAVVVHLLCRSIPEQGVHVVVAAGCGLAGGALLLGTSAQTGALGVPALLVAVAAGLGRAAVIPLVHRRRQAAPHDFPAAA